VCPDTVLLDETPTLGLGGIDGVTEIAGFGFKDVGAKLTVKDDFAATLAGDGHFSLLPKLYYEMNKHCGNTCA
jgi:hypothetical protein